ncbi:hypothetical protein V8E52_004954 [Russula decolorans]
MFLTCVCGTAVRHARWHGLVLPRTLAQRSRSQICCCLLTEGQGQEEGCSGLGVRCAITWRKCRCCKRTILPRISCNYHKCHVGDAKE